MFKFFLFVLKEDMDRNLKNNFEVFFKDDR